MSISVTGTPSSPLLAQIAAGVWAGFSCVLTNSVNSDESVTGVLSTTYSDSNHNGSEVSYVFVIDPLISITVDTISIYKNEDLVIQFTSAPSISFALSLIHI